MYLRIADATLRGNIRTNGMPTRRRSLGLFATGYYQVTLHATSAERGSDRSSPPSAREPGTPEGGREHRQSGRREAPPIQAAHAIEQAGQGAGQQQGRRQGPRPRPAARASCPAVRSAAECPAGARQAPSGCRSRAAAHPPCRTARRRRPPRPETAPTRRAVPSAAYGNAARQSSRPPVPPSAAHRTPADCGRCGATRRARPRRQWTAAGSMRSTRVMVGSCASCERGNVDLRSRLGIQTQQPHLARHADDFARLRSRVAQAHEPADRILTGKVAARQRGIDDDHGRGALRGRHPKNRGRAAAGWPWRADTRA